MAKYSNTKAKINEKITTNGAQAVTGGILNDVLQTMVDSLGADYQFGGLVQPGSSFTAGEQPVVFLATTPGTYTNFGGLVVAVGEVALLVWSGTAWSKQTPDISTRTEVSQLGQQVIYDVTANNAGAKFASLSALLSSENLSTLIPIAVRCGGMSIRFVQSSDNTYVQYRLHKNDWSAIVGDWESEKVEISQLKTEIYGTGSVVDLSNAQVNDYWIADTKYTNFGTHYSIPLVDSICTVEITPSNKLCVYTFVASDQSVADQSLDFALGVSQRVILPANSATAKIEKPVDAKFLIIGKQAMDGDYTPLNVLLRSTSNSPLEFQVERIKEEIDGVVLNIDVDSLVSCGGTIVSSTNKWLLSNDYFGSIIDVRAYRGKSVLIKASSDSDTLYSFIKAEPSWYVGTDVQYATGYNSVVRLTKNHLADATVPDDAKYLYVYLQSPGIDYRPQSIVIIGKDTIGRKVYDLQKEVEVLGNSLLQCASKEKFDLLKKVSTPFQIKVATWNIGHFSLGVYKDSTITSEDYAEKLAAFRSLVYNSLNANILGINEYSAIFGDGKNAKDVLFNDYIIEHEGVQRNYSCNSLFGDIYIENYEQHDFVSMQNETITHTSSILATDYYYETADLYVRGRKIKLFITHLAFDNNRPSVLQLKQIDELISVAEDESFVLMIGDWNVYDQSDFDPFVAAGYTLANDGTIYTYPATNPNKAYDNIIVKGLQLSNVGVVQSLLSDHIPLYATLSI